MQTISATASPSTTKTTTWNIDGSHSTAAFTVRHMMITNVRGEFQKLSGTVVYDAARPEATVIEVSIDAASINTREAQRDTHLRSADFFDVENHPSLLFRSRAVRVVADGLEVTGDLTMRGTSREVVLHVEGPTAEHADPWGNVRVGASATTKIKRSDWGMVWNNVIEAGGVLVSDEIRISLDVSLVRAK